MRRLLKYAVFFALAVAIGAYIVLGPPSLDNDAVRAPAAERESAAADVDPTAPAPLASSGSIEEEVAKRIALETAKAERRFVDEKAPAPDNPGASTSASSDASRTPLPATPLPRDAAPATAAARVSNDASQNAKPANEAERPAAPVAEMDGAARTQPAALASDEICQQDGERLEQLRGHPSNDDLVRFANELGCKKLLPQVVSLLKSLAPPLTAPSAPDSASPDGPGGHEEARPAPPPLGAEAAALTSDETCRHDQDRLARLRASPSGEEAQRFAGELSCEALRPQLQRLMEGLGLAAPAPPGPTNLSLPSSGLPSEGCVSERAALDRLRKAPSEEAARLFWRNLHCEDLRPQVRLLMESLNVAPEPVVSASGEEKGDHESAAADPQTANGADPAECSRERTELNRVRATPDLGDAKRFASTVTCRALKPQVARLLESFGE